MRTLLTGGSGQLGQELQRTAPKSVQLWTPDREELDLGRLELIAEIVAREQPELIINAAAYNHVDAAEENPSEAFAVNSQAVRSLAEVAAQHGCRLIHFSTDFVFSGDTGRPYQPGDAPGPLSAYGRSKLAGETAVLTTAADLGIVLRTSWLYSAFGNNFVKTILKLTQKGHPIDVIADQVGSPTCATGLARAVWQVTQRPAMAGTYHWSDAGVASWYDLASAVVEEAAALGLIRHAVPVRPIRTDQRPAKAARSPYTALDCSSTWSKLQTEPLHWRTALRGMLGELQEQDRG